MKKIILYFMLFAGICQAQVLNIEKERLDQDTLKPWKMKISADLKLFNRTAAEDNPVRQTKVELDYSSIYEPRKHAYILIAEIDFQRVNGDGIMEFGFVHGRVNWLKEKRLSYETFVQISYDGTRGLDVRTLAGGGLRYALLDNENWELYVAPGIMLENENWQHPYEDINVHSTILKSANYVHVKWRINDVLDLSNAFYYQAGMFDNQLRNRFSNWFILNTRISKTISLKNTLITNYEDKPIVPITKFIYVLKTGISVNL